jgi:hypothetical protein
MVFQECYNRAEGFCYWQPHGHVYYYKV